MKIVCLTSIKDTVEGRPTFLEKGDVVSINDRDAQRFMAHGWAAEPDTEPAKGLSAAPVDLNVHSGKLGVKNTGV